MRFDPRELKPYVSARSITNSGTIFLDANESQAQGEWRRYPNRQNQQLCLKLANHYGVNSENILYDRGLDEIISLVMRAFCPPGSSIKCYPPTYGMYAVEASILGLNIIKIDLDEKGLIPLSAEKKDPGTPALVIVCRPNNPLGTVDSLKTIEELARIYEGVAPIFVDEAYGEFMLKDEKSALELINTYDIIVGRTFSKALGLAGLRFGCALGNKRLLERLAIVQKPYPIATPVISFILDNFDSSIRKDALNTIREILEQKPIWSKALKKQLGISPYESGANFLSFQDPRAELIADILSAEGIITRVFKSPRLIWRVTIGTSAQLELIIKILERKL